MPAQHRSSGDPGRQGRRGGSTGLREGPPLQRPHWDLSAATVTVLRAEDPRAVGLTHCPRSSPGPQSCGAPCSRAEGPCRGPWISALPVLGLSLKSAQFPASAHSTLHARRRGSPSWAPPIPGSSSRHPSPRLHARGHSPGLVSILSSCLLVTFLGPEPRWVLSPKTHISRKKPDTLLGPRHAQL